MLRLVVGRQLRAATTNQGCKHRCLTVWTATTEPSTSSLIQTSQQEISFSSAKASPVTSQCRHLSSLRNLDTSATHESSLSSSTEWSSTSQSPLSARVVLFSTSAVHEDDGDEKEDELPPNLTFDRRSSFGPAKQQKLKLVRPKKAKEATDGDGSKSVETKEEEGDHDDDELVDEDEEDEDWDESQLDEAESRYVIPLPDRLHVDIRDALDGGVTNGTIWLEESVFGQEDIRVDLIKRNVNYIRNKIRGKRKSKTKTIGEVSGSGKKVRQQKGTGRARAGHSRPAHWRGGAKAHGPKNTKDYGDIKMNKKARRLAICSTLSQKLKEGNLILVDNLKLESHKTKEWAKTLEEVFGIGQPRISRTDVGGATALIVDHFVEEEIDDDEEAASYNGVPVNLWVASNNLLKVKVMNQSFLNVFEILKKDKLMITLSALEQIEAKWKH